MRQALVADRRIGADPSVIWAGHSDSRASYVAAADVIAVPSRVEGLRGDSLSRNGLTLATRPARVTALVLELADESTHKGAGR